MRHSSLKSLMLVISLVLLFANSEAEERTQLATDSYVRAEDFLPWNVTKLVLNLRIVPNWIGDSDHFWYRNDQFGQRQFILIDPSTNRSEPAFDHFRLADMLSEASGQHYSGENLPFENFIFTNGGHAIEFTVDNLRWICDMKLNKCERSLQSPTVSPMESVSPDQHWSAFIRDHNLYVRSVAFNEEIQLTTDGELYNDYATSPDSNVNAITARILSEGISKVNVIWSPDSKKLLTYRLDQRKVKDFFLIQAVSPHGEPRPLLYSYKYPLPGDNDVATASLVIFDLEHKTRTFLKLPPQPVTYETPLANKFVWWSPKSDLVFVIQTDRWRKRVELDAVKAQTGAVRKVIEELGKTYVNLAPESDDSPPLTRVLGNGAEVIWFSERDGWGHLYLYDGRSGTLKNRITTGAWLVREIIHIDEVHRWLYFTIGGYKAGEDPYFRRLFRIKLDGSDLQALTSENADHEIIFSPSGNYFVDTCSRPDLSPVFVLRTADGKFIRELGRADTRKLVASGWIPPEIFATKAADGFTDIYGILYRPPAFDSSKSYPIIDGIYPGPQLIQVHHTFEDALRFGGGAVAQLGFISVVVDGRGTPLRSKAFLDYSYGNLGDAGGLKDHIAALRQLAQRYRYIDLERVGITGHSAGGYATVRAMLAYPDFYKVGVASAGPGDLRSYIAFWGEVFQGPYQGTNYIEASNVALAEKQRLKGKLLLVLGDLDDNVSPYSQLQLVHALVRANSDFEMLILPNRNHMYYGDPYYVRRRWDYFVRNLMGMEPPPNYELKPPPGYNPLDTD